MIIGFFTTSRAEFGLLSNLIDEVIQDGSLGYMLFVGGGHHVVNQGKSVDEIKERKYSWVPFDFLLSSDNPKSLVQSMATETFQLAEIFSNYHFDVVCLLGDRLELLPIVQSAIVFRKPIIHLHGGEITEGAVDDQVRHMITKAAHIHFSACEEYRKNIIRMGEDASRVYNVGALGVSSMEKVKSVSRIQIFQKYQLDTTKPTVLLTYHPVTLEFGISAAQQMRNVFEALRSYNFQVIITAPNVDLNNQDLFGVIDEEVRVHKGYFFIKSLGINNYQSMLRHVEFVIGNSSSGLLEVPYYKIPTINIGDRQKGRIKHQSVIDTGYSVEDIRTGIEKALDISFRKSLEDMEYKFGDSHAAERIVKILKNMTFNADFLRKRLEFPNA